MESIHINLHKFGPVVQKEMWFKDFSKNILFLALVILLKGIIGNIHVNFNSFF